ncbi:MAG: hypothetical protein AAF487_11610 [Bacteroidota bacterium]
MLTQKVERKKRKSLLDRVVEDMIQREESQNIEAKAQEIKDYLARRK